MLDMDSEMKLRTQKERRLVEMLGPVRGQVQVNSNGTCVWLLTNSKGQGFQPSLQMVKWWGPVAEIGSSMRFL